MTVAFDKTLDQLSDLYKIIKSHRRNGRDELKIAPALERTIQSILHSKRVENHATRYETERPFCTQLVSVRVS